MASTVLDRMWSSHCSASEIIYQTGRLCGVEQKCVSHLVAGSLAWGSFGREVTQPTSMQRELPKQEK
jgi:hypothetical protein